MGNTSPRGENGSPSSQNNQRSASFHNRLSNFNTSNFTQGVQAKTREVAQKFKMTTTGSFSKNKDSTDDSIDKATGRGGGFALRGNQQKQPPKMQSAIQGIKIENDPLEREIYVKCPGCSRKVFDSGLENELE